jgi:hypothetical protein
MLFVEGQRKLELTTSARVNVVRGGGEADLEGPEKC